MLELDGYHQYWNYCGEERIFRDGSLYEEGAAFRDHMGSE